MEEIYWNRFLETGKIEDYLYYKGMEICKNVLNKHESEANGESDHGDRHGACSYGYRGI